MILSQDVAVDGWALTMLKPKNVGYASTCNSVGQVESLKNSSVFKKILCFSTSLLWWSKAIFSHVYCSKKFLRSKQFLWPIYFLSLQCLIFISRLGTKKIYILALTLNIYTDLRMVPGLHPVHYSRECWLHHILPGIAVLILCNTNYFTASHFLFLLILSKWFIYKSK